MFAASDPLALVAINAGQVGTPATEAAAAGSSRLDTDQRSITIGEPVPIAFCRRRNGYGGILVSPGASEARFENDTSNAVTAYYLLVVSEGQLPGIQRRDVYQGLCRVGSHSQTYNRRAGTWQPGNAIVQREGFTKPEASYYCGTRGAYPGMTTVSFQVTIPDGFDVWKKQVHLYLRGGMQVTRLTDSQFGPSDNFCDLAKWMMLNSGRWPAALIDDEQLAATADFLEDNNLTCNCWITESSNYLDYLAKWAPLFLLCESNRAGKRGLRPILPITSSNQIDTGTISPVFTFTEDNIVSGTVEIQYTSLADRRPFVVQAIWRQQLEDDFGIIRTAEIRLPGTAASGPYESHDLSEFCTRESHAVMVAAHILARRVYTTHTIRFTARPQASNLVVTQGDIIRVRLARQTSGGGTSWHDYLYQVQRITKTLSGELSYECTHFPVDGQGRSLISLAVASTSGTGILLTSNRSGIGCDLNSATDATVPDETFSLPDLDGLGGGTINVGGGFGFEQPPSGEEENPDDGLDTGVPILAPSFVDASGNPTAPSQDSFVDPYGVNPCGAGEEAKNAYYINGEQVQIEGDYFVPVEDENRVGVSQLSGRVPAYIGGLPFGPATDIEWPDGAQLEVFWYCADASGNPVLSARSGSIPLASRGTIVDEYVYILVGRPDGSLTQWIASRWISRPITYEKLFASAFAWGGANGRVVKNYYSVGWRYSNGSEVRTDNTPPPL